MKSYLLFSIILLMTVTLSSYNGFAIGDPVQVSQNEQPEDDESAASDDLAEDEDGEEEDESEPLDAAIPPATPAQAEAPKVAPEKPIEKPAEPTQPPSALSLAPATPVVVPKIIAAPKAKTAKKFVGFKTVKSACSMREAADSASKEVGKTKTGAKLWVEETNESWFKVMRKAGAAYVNIDCLK